eukprot:snap_masked-scaffold_15-processed-gene-8.44-mRNA-1 protein AED:1.00 eAED:1.00 QI:0/0/0/0/1/1/3/0/357
MLCDADQQVKTTDSLSLFEEKFHEAKLLDADFKPKWLWTEKDKKEYHARASKKYRVNLKISYETEKNYNLQLEQEVIEKRKDLENLMNVYNELSMQREIQTKRWDFVYLFKQNNFTKIFGVLKNTAEQSFDLVSKIEISKHGRISYKKDSFACINNRNKTRLELNKKLAASKSNYFGMRLITLCIDKNMKNLINFKYKIRNFDYTEYTEIMYRIFHANIYENSFVQYVDIDYHIIHLDSRNIPFDSTFTEKKGTCDFQAFDVSVYKPKFDAPTFLMVAALIRHSTFSTVFKTQLFYDEESNNFFPYSKGISVCTITKLKGKDILVNFASTALPKNRMEEIIEVSKGVWLQHKKDSFR